MDGTDDSKSYFSAAGQDGGLGAEVARLKLLQQQIANRHNAGSPSRATLLQQPNVLIPSTGAAKYWYVDPKAQNIPNNPMAYAAPQRFDEGAYRNLGPNVNQLRALEIARGQAGQDRPDGYAEMRKNTPGMIDVPTMDLEGGAEGTSIHEMDGKFYILPTQVNGVKFNPLDRFRNTGEHLGVFNAEDDASIFEEKNLKDLGAKQFQLLPPNFQLMLMRKPNSYMRFAGERDDLLRDIDNTVYGGGHAPAPTPTPTPTSPRYFPISYFT